MSIDVGMPRIALAHAPDRHAMIPRFEACQPSGPSRTMFRCKMDERRKFDNNNNNNNTNDNKAPAVNIDDGQHDRGEWGPWTGAWTRGRRGLVLAVARYGTAGRSWSVVYTQ